VSLQIHRADLFDVLDAWTGPLFDFVFADLPYGTTQNKWDTVIDLPRMWMLLRKVCKPSAAMCFTCQQPFTTTLVNSNIREFRYDWIWEKNRLTGHLNAKKAPLKKHESVVVFYRQQPAYRPQKTDGHRPTHSTRPNAPKRSNYGAETGTAPYVGQTERYPSSIQQIAAVSLNRHKRYTLHPTEKPVALYEYFLRTYTNPGDLALDPTAGVLTMAMAAHNTGRSCVVIERERGYVDNGLQRLRDVEASYNLHTGVGE
jgi:DNA modification methylase